MPTEEEKQAERERVTRLSGFRVGWHDFQSEVAFDALKKRNDEYEARHGQQSALGRKTDEMIRMAAYIAMKNPVHMIQIHVHGAHKAGATAEELYDLINFVGDMAGGAARQMGMEAWRLTFRPELPPILRISDLG